jgi:hypothetical protein
MSNNFVSQIQLPPPSAPIDIPIIDEPQVKGRHSRLYFNVPPIITLVIPERSKKYIPGSLIFPNN